MCTFRLDNHAQRDLWRPAGSNSPPNAHSTHAYANLVAQCGCESAQSSIAVSRQASLVAERVHGARSIPEHRQLSPMQALRNKRTVQSHQRTCAIHLHSAGPSLYKIVTNGHIHAKSPRERAPHVACLPAHTNHHCAGSQAQPQVPPLAFCVGPT